MSDACQSLAKSILNDNDDHNVNLESYYTFEKKKEVGILVSGRGIFTFVRSASVLEWLRMLQFY